MKKILIGLLTLISLPSFAGALGTPDEDPVVANLRERFKNGFEPKAEDLLQHAYNCTEMSAFRGDFSRINHTYDLTFDQFDGFLVVVEEDTVMNNVLLTFNGKELIGSTKDGVVLYGAYRVDNKGFLIIEFSIVKDKTSAELVPISSSNGKVGSYTLCVPR
jgi:hypothetical protein